MFEATQRAVAAIAVTAMTVAATASADTVVPVRPGALLAAGDELGDPRDAAFAPDGSLLVALAAEGRVVRFAVPAAPQPLPAAPTATEVLDPARTIVPPTRLVPIASYDGFDRPVSLDVAGDGTIVVLDAAARTLVALDPAAPPSDRMILARDLVEPRRVVLGGEAAWVVLADPPAVLRVDLDGGGVTEVAGADAFAEPTAIAVHPDGRIAMTGLRVADSGAGAAAIGDPLVVVTDTRGREAVRFGDLGPFPGLLERPTDIAWDGDRIVVVDANNHRIQHHELDGTAILTWGLHARQPREAGGVIHYPEAMTVDAAGDRIAIVEPFEDRVQVFTRDPDAVDRRNALRPPLIARDAHFGPRLATEGNALFLAEPDAHRVHFFDMRRETPIVVGEFGERGVGPGLLLRTEAIDFDVDTGVVELGDIHKRRLQRIRVDWTSDERLGFKPGRFRFTRMQRLDPLAAAPADLGPVSPSDIVRLEDGGRFVVDTPRDRIVRLDASGAFVAVLGGRGTEPGRFRRPTDAVLGAGGETLWVVDADNRRVQGIDVATGTTEVVIGGRGSDDGQFLDPFGVAIASDGSVLVTDAGRHDVQAFAASGEHRWTAGRRAGGRRAGFWKPAGIAVRPDGRIIVVDWGNHIAKVLDPDGRWRLSFGLGRPTYREGVGPSAAGRGGGPGS